jgi:hypothetical protein
MRFCVTGHLVCPELSLPKRFSKPLHHTHKHTHVEQSPAASTHTKKTHNITKLLHTKIQKHTKSQSPPSYPSFVTKIPTTTKSNQGKKKQNHVGRRREKDLAPRYVSDNFLTRLRNIPYLSVESDWIARTI